LTLIIAQRFYQEIYKLVTESIHEILFKRSEITCISFYCIGAE